MYLSTFLGVGLICGVVEKVFGTIHEKCRQTIFDVAIPSMIRFKIE
jgi:hypothetical protein